MTMDAISAGQYLANYINGKRAMSIRIEAIKEIPANEQCIGHFQMAVVALLHEMNNEMAKLQQAIYQKPTPVSDKESSK